MTTPPKTREEWETAIKSCFGIVKGFLLRKELDATIDSIMSLQDAANKRPSRFRVSVGDCHAEIMIEAPYNPPGGLLQMVFEKAIEQQNRLKAEVERLREDVKHERTVSGIIMAAGNALGNIAYNGAQSDRVPEDYRKSMKDAVTDWDKAREKARSDARQLPRTT